MTQNEIIIEVLRTGEGLTAADALYRYGIGRLASRICELRKASYPILSIRTQGTNRYGEKVYYDTYRLDMEKYKGVKNGSNDTKEMHG